MGQRASQASQTGSTRATGVCWSMTSETRTPQAEHAGQRQGRSRWAEAYHRTSGVLQATAPPRRSSGRSSHARSILAPARVIAPRVVAVSVLRPVGPLPARVYWVRRVLLAALVILALLSPRGPGAR